VCWERLKNDGTKNKKERKANDAKINGEKQLRKMKRKGMKRKENQMNIALAHNFKFISVC